MANDTILCCVVIPKGMVVVLLTILTIPPNPVEPTPATLSEILNATFETS